MPGTEDQDQDLLATIHDLVAEEHALHERSSAGDRRHRQVLVVGARALVALDLAVGVGGIVVAEHSDVFVGGPGPGLDGPIGWFSMARSGQPGTSPLVPSRSGGRSIRPVRHSGSAGPTRSGLTMGRRPRAGATATTRAAPASVSTPARRP